MPKSTIQRPDWVIKVRKGREDLLARRRRRAYTPEEEAAFLDVQTQMEALADVVKISSEFQSVHDRMVEVGIILTWQSNNADGSKTYSYYCI